MAIDGPLQRKYEKKHTHTHKKNEKNRKAIEEMDRRRPILIQSRCNNVIIVDVIITTTTIIIVVVVVVNR